MNEYTIGPGDRASFSIGTLYSEHGGGGYLTGDFEGKVSYQRMCRRRLWKWGLHGVLWERCVSGGGPKGPCLGDGGGGGGYPFAGNFER
jgi:hypothetical protein